MRHSNKDFFAAFGQAAEQNLPPVMVSGRHAFHDRAVPSIVEDVIAKLRPQPHGRLLEIGCGLGLILRPLAALVREAVGIDHPSLLHELARLEPPVNLTLVPGRFPEAKPAGNFDYIVVYSVLHYMTGADEARAFVDQCLELLAPGGRLLIGDIPNADAQRRFRVSTEAKQINEEYDEARKADQKTNSKAYAVKAQIEHNVVLPPSFLDDQFALGMLSELRVRGYESYLLPQPPGLPFNMTREDLLIHRRR